MADLSSTFMGIELASPVIVGASPFSRTIANVRKAEDAGAGALVIYSLFQEQIEHEREGLDEALKVGADHFAESLTYFPQMEHAGPREHVMWIEKTRAEVSFPLIGSLNAIGMGEWTEYARQLEAAGCNGLELNLYDLQTDMDATSTDVENRRLDIVAAVRSQVKIPIAVKLSPWYTATASFIYRVAKAGADGVVLFNRFYQPTIDPEKEQLRVDLDLSRAEDLRLPLRWIAILSGEIEVDFAASTGVHSGKDVVRQLLAGARAAQSVSALLKNGLDYVKTMNCEIAAWMDTHGYATTDEFRGKLNQKGVKDPYAFERAQYVTLLMGHE